MSKIKQLYKGMFSFRSELSVEYAYAFTERQAKAIMLRRLANKHEVSYSTVFGMFNGDKQNFKVTVEVEFKEVQEEANG